MHGVLTRASVAIDRSVGDRLGDHLVGGLVGLGKLGCAGRASRAPRR